jgi:hypothetical protein
VPNALDMTFSKLTVILTLFVKEKTEALKVRY